MKQIKIQIPLELEKDVQKLGSTVAKNIAIKAREEITNAYYMSIVNFYQAYTPIQYVRTWELVNSYEKYYTNSHGKIFYGGVIITPNNMSDTHNDPYAEVLDYSIHGWHGHPSKNISTSPSPLEYTINFRDSIFDNLQVWGSEAIANAKLQNYSILKFK